MCCRKYGASKQWVVLLAVVLSLNFGPAFAAPPIVSIDGVQAEWKHQPILDGHGLPWVPLREILPLLGTMDYALTDLGLTIADEDGRSIRLSSTTWEIWVDKLKAYTLGSLASVDGVPYISAETLQLVRGDYSVLFDQMTGHLSVDSRAALSTSQYYDYLRREEAWGLSYFGAPSIKSPSVSLFLPSRAGITCEGFFRLKGNTALRALEVRVRKGESQWWTPLTLEQGNFNQRIWLPGGKGTHIVDIMVPASTPGQYSTDVSFTVVNDRQVNGGAYIGCDSFVTEVDTGYVELNLWSPFRRVWLKVVGPDGYESQPRAWYANAYGEAQVKAYLGSGPGKYEVWIGHDKPGSADRWLIDLTLQVATTASVLGENGVALSDQTMEQLTRGVENSVVLRGSTGTDFPVTAVRVYNAAADRSLRFSVGGSFDRLIAFPPEVAGDCVLEFRGLSDHGRQMLYSIPFKVTVTDPEAYLVLPQLGVDSTSPEIVALATELTESSWSDFEKARAIHDWVARNVAYDTAELKEIKAGRHVLFGTLDTYYRRKGVCHDYANLFAALARAAGIKTRIISGTASGESHAWNQAFVDGRWINVDVTWDAGFVHQGEFIARISWTYFGVPFSNHQAKAEVTGWR
ncbi:MAG: transglutaminase-like domain-containing protein [Bacillota bacterium]